MNFSFETLPIAHKEELQKGILQQFGRDITPVPCAFSTRNYVFIFSEGCFPAIIRVSPEMPHRKKEDVLSELMWIDDLKNDVKNVCQPIPSLFHRMVERIQVGENAFLVTMFRKANGTNLPAKYWDSAYFYNAGKLLGKIHRSSYEGYLRGFRYKRKHWYETAYYQFADVDDYLGAEAHQQMDALLLRIKSIPRDPRWYGMIHGDFNNVNMFSDWGELWAFDFDDSCYGYFMFDVACMVHFCTIGPYADIFPGMTMREIMFGEDGNFTHFRAGYTSEHQLPDEQWDLIDDFFRLRNAEIIGINLVHKTHSKDFMRAFDGPGVSYFQQDKSPFDRVEEVSQERKNRMKPEVYAALSKMLLG